MSDLETFDWQEFLEGWNTQTMGLHKLDLFEEDYHWTVIRQGGHCFPAAAPQHIAEAEQRLGTTLTWVRDFGAGTGEDPEQALHDHGVYGSRQYPPRYQRAYVRECVQLSERLAEVNCVFLLNPALVFESGEWEAWFMAA